MTTDKMVDSWTEKDCDRCGIRFQFTRTEPRPEPDEYVCPECAAYERGTKEAEAELERVKAERDQAQANYEWMVQRAADEKLDGYRDLGARVAQAQAERDHFRVQLRGAQERGLEAEVAAEKAKSVLHGLRDDLAIVDHCLVTAASVDEQIVTPAELAAWERIRRALEGNDD